MTSMKVFMTTALLCSAVSQSCIAAEWLLLSREGGCVPLDTLKRKLPELPSVQTPEAFEAYLKAAAVMYSRKVHAEPGGSFNEFQVPSAGLSVVLVPRRQCREVLQGPH